MKRFFEWLRTDVSNPRSIILALAAVSWLSGYLTAGAVKSKKFRIPAAPGHLWITKGPLRRSEIWMKVECLVMGHAWTRSYFPGDLAICNRCGKSIQDSGL